MKKVIYLAAMLLIVPAVCMGQNKEMKKLFNRYDDVSGFTLKTEEADIDIDMDGDFSRFLEELDDIYVLKFNKDKGNLSDVDAFESKLLKICDKNGFYSMFDIESEGSVKMLSAKNKEDQTTDYLLITHGDEQSMFLWATSN